MNIYKRNDAGEEMYCFTDEFIKLIQLRLALEIARDMGVTLNENEIGTRKFWTSAKFVNSTKKALGESISDITMRRCFGKVIWNEKPNHETLGKFCKYLGIGWVPDVRSLSATELERRIFEHVNRASFTRREPLCSIIDYDREVVKSDTDAFIRNDKDEIVYIASNNLKKDIIIEVKLDTHNQERYAFKKTQEDKNRFKVLSCPRDSKLHPGDLLTIESFGLDVKINGWNFHRFVDSFEIAYGVYISKGTITKIIAHY